MPTTATQVYGAGRLDPVYDARAAEHSIINVSLPNSVTYAKGTVLAETGTPGQYAAVVAGTAPAAMGLLQYACSTDASGNITVTGEWGVTRLAVPMYTTGHFRVQDVPASGAGLLDANALSKLGGHLVEGALAGNGIFRF